MGSVRERIFTSPWRSILRPHCRALSNKLGAQKRPFLSRLMAGRSQPKSQTILDIAVSKGRDFFFPQSEPQAVERAEVNPERSEPRVAESQIQRSARNL
jgi:hypothetical protein